MATIVVRVEPEDPDAWYADHMNAIPAFKEAGVTSEIMYRDRNEPNARVGILEVDDVDRFFAFLSKAAGPRKYRPTLWVLEEVERTIQYVRFEGRAQSMAELDRDSKAFVVREASDDDAAQMQQFLADLFAEKLPVLFRRKAPPTVEEERAAVEALSASPSNVCLIAAAGQKVVGTLDFHGSTKGQREHLGGFGVSVAKGWRRRGVATALIERLEAWARSKQFRRIELEVFENNVGAINLYEKLGFEIEGRRREAVEVDGAFIDVIVMAKLI